jgi:hypothetical protein
LMHTLPPFYATPPPTLHCGRSEESKLRVVLARKAVELIKSSRCVGNAKKMAGKSERWCGPFFILRGKLKASNAENTLTL